MALYRSQKIKSALIFLVAAVVVTLLYPSKVKFKYDYSLGQPWRYEGVLTAPYNYYVYKGDAQKVAERDSIERTMVHYYTIDPKIKLTERHQLTEDFTSGAMGEEVTSDYIQYALQVLDKVYDQGILSNESFEALAAQEERYIYLVDEMNVAKKREINEIFNARKAYDYTINNAPEKLKPEILQQVNFEKYLLSNLSVDEIKSSQMQNARLATLSEVIGEVQKGERIVGTGDVVTPEIYQMLEGYRMAYEETAKSKGESFFLFAGQLVLILILFGILYTYIVSFREELMKNTKDILFITSNVTFFTILAYLLIPNEPAVTYMLPLSMVAINCRIFLDSRTASIVHLTTVLMASLVVPSPLTFIIIQVVAGRIVLVTLRKLTQRSDLIRTSFAVFFGMVVVYFAMEFAFEGIPNRVDWNIIFYFTINFIFLMFTYLVVYVIERGFGYVSSISLIELADINKPLLRQLSEVAPGTFQHSLNVSTLASEAIGEIGGDIRLVRSGALYHDIGKMKNPTYFTENQGATNPHDRLTYDQSAKIIIKHITDGIEMAEKAKLPKPIIDFIRTHHGLGMTKYFYIKYKNENPNIQIDESIFRYPGPNPWTREQGILMLADAVEASSRSLKEITEEVLIDHVNKIVDGIVADGYLKNTPLTFRDIETTKFVFTEKLRNMYHSRIDYPELTREKITEAVKNEDTVQHI